MRPSFPARTKPRRDIQRPTLPRLLAAALAITAGLASADALAAQTVVQGRITSGDGPVVGAEVTLELASTSIPDSRSAPPGPERAGRDHPTTTSGPDGRYRLEHVPPGQWSLRARALGYQTIERPISVAEGDTVAVDLTMETAALPVDPLVVTGTLTEIRVGDSPVKVDVVSARLLQRNASSSLMESIGQINGLYQQVDCAVCYTNSIRINGMEGPYTAVLIDGMPIMGALASVYGLNGIHPALIDRLEILKGPQSTLYGTEAMGGVVNVITKDPRLTPRWTVDASRSDLGETSLHMAATADRADVSGLASGTFLHNGRFVDDNGDGFSDLTMDTRLTLFGKGQLRRDGQEVLGVSAKVYREDRFGGVESWRKEHRGSDEIYGESIRTARAELMGTGRLPGTGLKADVSWAWHRQDSWYGAEAFMARQHIAFAQLLWDMPPLRDHDLLLGATLRGERYDDDTPATATADRTLIPGLLVQDQWRIDSAWTVLSGLRVDHHGEHGTIPAPRLSVRWQPFELTTLRLNAGTGFRVVNLFTEDHAALTGARDVVIQEDLEPERSRSVALNLNQEVRFGPNPMMIDLDLFHTRFGNRIRPDYDTHPDRILYRNLEGTSVSRGLSVSLNQNFALIPLFYTAGITFQDVHLREDGVTRKELFSPDYTGTWTVSYTFFERLTMDWSGRVTGPMRLPSYPEPFTRPVRSDAHTIHHLQGTWKLGSGTELYLGARNVLDFTQDSPLIAPAEPFGDAFDTNYVWGPVVGRRLVLGIRTGAGR